MSDCVPLSALLSLELAAFDIEFDNEFEHKTPHRDRFWGILKAGSLKTRQILRIVKERGWRLEREHLQHRPDA